MIENMKRLNANQADATESTKKRWTEKASDVQYDELKRKLRQD
jgi:hypothetical protein